MRSDEEVTRYGGIEAGCKREDMEVFASRAPELWRCTAGVGPSRYRALEACCRRRDVSEA